MDLQFLASVAEQLRRDSIGGPAWNAFKHRYDYADKTVKVAVVLKIIRAAQGVHSMDLLCERGLFVDMGAIYRCINDCNSEVYFLLVNFPNTSRTVDKFLKEFFTNSGASDHGLKVEPVPSKKIRSAVARVLTGKNQDDATLQRLQNVFSTFSGYTHAGYSHVMQMFGGTQSSRSFNISG